ncbi:CCCH-type zinc fingerfamily protein with RNA-binding domain-containing protein [Rhynchospora pubera]|uniref:CCCH-type zinc fingerfamily protein with RNA-binding domain-containing protein n=1 Tax=Rhynchospora pubera TaxID=906938 RepID=A0AAV8CH57_9POAL|nr:CCCH-type zinc fingerfamily protein with RNA-binding domain-containing protein [Rhynchospora pubera]
MDAYEATRIVFSRIQTLDPENAAKIMGLLLIQDHGEKEMIRLAFGPETLLQSVIAKARKELGLVPSSNPGTPTSVSTAPSPFHLSRQNSASRLPSPLSVSSPSSWAPPPVFSRSNSCNGTISNGLVDELQASDELISPGCNGTGGPTSPFFGARAGTDLIDELQLQDQMSFLNETGAQGDFMDYAAIGNGHHRRSCSVSDICFSGSNADGLGWKPCLYYARGYCKNGTSCRFVHGLPDESAMLEQELLLRSKSQRLMAAASGFPFSPTGSMPASPSGSSKCLNFFLQQQSENQRAVAAAAALMLGGDDAHKLMGRSRFDRVDFMNMMNPSSRQIYLTFPADSTFREEDVSNYFSIYGPVQDVRIPYQQKRMFGFVTFVYPETVKLILAKGNPHFICDARVLVKPYKEKGKVPEKYRTKPAGDRGDFSGCTTPTGLDSRDSFDLQQLGARMLHGNNTTEMLIRRKLEEQQQAAELQQAIELQSRRLMGLQLLDLKSRSFSSHGNGNAGLHSTTAVGSPPIAPIAVGTRSSSISPDETRTEGKSPTDESSFPQQRTVNVASADKEESTDEASPNADSDFQESSVEHNLPDSPFASPTAAKSAFGLDPFSVSDAEVSSINSASGNGHLLGSPLLSPATSLDMASAKSYFLPMTRISSDHGAIGM